MAQVANVPLAVVTIHSYTFLYFNIVQVVKVPKAIANSVLRL